MEFGLALSALALVSVLCGVVGSAIAACALVVIRFRHAAGDERAQLKWSCSRLRCCHSGCASTCWPRRSRRGREFGRSCVFPRSRDAPHRDRGRNPQLPALRDRPDHLPDVVYGLLTVVLGAIYVGLVLAAKRCSRRWRAGQPGDRGLDPLRRSVLPSGSRRVQAFVDRRFYRRRYDARRTLEAFGSRLREQIELDALSEDLLSAVGETMQPTLASLWLNDSQRHPKPVTIP